MNTLNEQQQLAAETLEGPVLVLSGAGTGKTRTLVSRIANLLALDPKNQHRILAVTFTNKAAREMHGRIAALFPDITLNWVGTFHSIANKILRMNAELFGLKPYFSILDTDDQITLLKSIIEEPLKKDKLKAVVNTIQRWKDKAMLPEQVEAQNYYEVRVLGYYKTYQQRLRESNSVDFGDLILSNIVLFENHPEILKQYQERFNYIMVDEYQDSNKVQYLWLRMLSARNHNICCVGDDDQSIYGWRGADVNNILKFSQDFPDSTVIRLERNYRSTHHILASASQVISNNSSRLRKKLWTEDQSGEKIQVMMFVDSNDEANYVTNLMRAEAQGSTPLNEMAILLRSSFQTRIFEEYLMKIGVPYRITGNMRFYDRKEIKDIIAYLRLVINDRDDVAFARIINTPKREFGETSVGKVRLEASSCNISMLEALQMMLGEGKFKRSNARLKDLINRIHHWKELARSDQTQTSELIKTIAQESGYIDMLMDDDEAAKAENIKELSSAASKFSSPDQFLQHISLITDTEDQTDKPMVNIMTLHAAKGLEFSHVFLPGWEEANFPHHRAIENGEIEEERRLAYVGITRAKHKLYISCAGRRFLNNHWQDLQPSRFLTELPEQNIELLSGLGRSLRRHRSYY